MTRSPVPPRRARAAVRLAALLLAGVAVLAGSWAGVSSALPAGPTAGAPAGAPEIYRYWIYFHVLDGSYVASEKGVGQFRPEDGSTEAYRYAAPADYTTPNLPRVDPAEVSFDRVCGAAEAAAGEKRVAVIVDYGVAQDADGADPPDPEAGCAVVPSRATALQVLGDVAPTRAENGLLCAVDGYPASGCSEVVRKATPTDEQPVEVTVLGATPEPDASGSAGADGADDGQDGTWLLLGAGALVVVLAGGGLALSRRHRSA